MSATLPDRHLAPPPLPGFSAGEVKGTLERGPLTIRAERADTSEEQGECDDRPVFVRELARGVDSHGVLIGDAYAPTPSAVRFKTAF